MANQFNSGKDAKAFVGATELPGTNWTLNILGNNKDVSNTRDGRKRIAGLQDYNGTVMLHWDSLGEPSSSPPNLQHGSILTNLKLQVDTTKFFMCPSAIVDSVKPSSTIDGTVDYEVAFSEESGGITYPV